MRTNETIGHRICLGIECLCVIGTTSFSIDVHSSLHPSMASGKVLATPQYPNLLSRLLSWRCDDDE